MRIHIVALWAVTLTAQAPAPRPAAAPADGPDHRSDQVLKALDDIMWHTKLGDIAEVDKVALTGPPLARESNLTGQGAGNPLIFHAYTFIPKKLDRTKKQPLLVFVHGGVHSNFSSTGSAHIIRELVNEGYTIVSPDYRGSTGYGAAFCRAIDYGGRENDDVWAARNWMLETHAFLDPQRVGLIGWSHGGMITLMNLFEHGEAYACGYAGVPVSDLVARMGYKGPAYEQLFAADYHIGKTARDNVQEYLRRSPVTHVAKLRTPLMIHTNTNDEDVNYLEVQRLATALKAEGKKFEYKVYENAPGGHVFNRLDTKLARESRAEIYAFLRRYLKP
jgi:dipeptidyl aminopeptidase/acylaminoacyl peptidase